MIPSRIQVQYEIDLDNLMEYFKTLDQGYLNQLLTEVNLDQYAMKLIDKASKIILRDGSKITAALFYYENTEGSYISHISVCKNAERQGLGKGLLELLKSKVTQRVILLEVNANNDKARKFYEIMGFREKSNSSYKLVMELLLT